MNPIAANVSSQNQAMIQNQVAVSMLKKTLDISAEQGALLVKMMAQGSGLGGRVDLYA